MLTQPLLDKLRTLRLPGLRAGLEEQLRDPRYADLSFEERLGLLIDIECARRDDGRRERRLQAARFALRATLEDLDLSPVRGLDRRLIFELGQGEWIERHLNAIVLGPTGAGKTYLACALGHAACKQGLPVRYERTSRLLGDLALAHADGSWPQALLGLARVRLLILDDWLRDPLTASQTRDLLAEGPAPAGGPRRSLRPGFHLGGYAGADRRMAPALLGSNTGRCHPGSPSSQCLPLGNAR